MVTPLLEQQKKERRGGHQVRGGVSARARLRSPPSRSDAVGIYAHYIKGGVPYGAEYKTLQDYLFRYIAREAGRLGLAVHIHTGGGCGGYFHMEGANPLLLDSVFNDPTLRKTNFVMLHGGAGGFEQLVPYLLMKPNVYADFSEQTWMTSPRHIAASIRFMLEFYPDKVLFGTDLYPFDAAGELGRDGIPDGDRGTTALAIALTGMMQDGEITRARSRRDRTQGDARQRDQPVRNE